MNVFYAQPVKPAGIFARAGTSQATVSWNGVCGATGYNVKRSTTSMGTYTTVFMSPTAIPSRYDDTSLAGGTTYYYVVSSINTISTCESANSTEVAVTPL
jgi:hypothetical protein